MHEFREIRSLRGSTCFREMVAVTLELRRYAELMLREVGWTGAAHLGFLVREREGEVNYTYQKDEAERAVRCITGVRGVSNMITVAVQPVPGDVKRKIKEALERGVEFDADRITVEVGGNTVTLRGTVRSYAEKIDAEHAARNAPGVTEVKNKLTVDPTVPAAV